jgi:hypothetical protein
MQLLLRDPTYTEQLAAFLVSVGQRPVVAGANRLELEGGGESTQLELELYLHVWRVLHPEADVELEV